MMQGFGMMGRYGMMGGGCGLGLGFGPLGIWMHLISIGLVLIIIGFGIKAYKKSAKSKENKVAFNELKSMYVRGEITEEEYVRRKTVIEGK